MSLHDLVVPTIVGSMVIVIGLVVFLAWRAHVKQRHVKRTNDRLNGGH